MADEADQAQVISDLFLAKALAVHTIQNRNFRPESITCIDCEEDIPEARRQAMPGCERCITCQTEYERSL